MARTPVSAAARKTNGKKNGATAKPIPRTVPETVVRLDALKPHPKNYKRHPEDQLLHLGESIRQHGVYRNVVAARGNVLVAGHGVVEAARRVGLTEIVVRRLDLDPMSPQALKILAADNELGLFAERDESALYEILKSVESSDLLGLIGTGYDDVRMTRLLSAITPPVDPDQEWNGMPEFDQQDKTAHRQIVVNFKSDADVVEFGKAIGQSMTGETRSIWFPKAEIERLMDKRYRSGAKDAAEE